MTNLPRKSVLRFPARFLIATSILLSSCGGPLVPFYVDYNDVPRDGLIGEWTFDYGLLDTSDTRATVTKEYGTKSYSRLPGRSSYYFDGSDPFDGAVVYSEKLKLNGNKKYSISFWMLYNPPYSTWNEVVSVGRNVTATFKSAVGLGWDSTSIFNNQENWGSGYGSSYALMTPTSQWAWINMVIVSDAVIVKCYINKLLAGTFPTNIAPNKSTGVVEFAHINSEKLYLDDVRLYNRALSAKEIDDLYHEGGYRN